MNAVVELKPQTGALAQSPAATRMAVADVIQHYAMVQEVKQAIMKPKVHFDTIPGTPKPTLLKPGAEALCMAFRVADDYIVEDLSTPDAVRYRVKCIGSHQAALAKLGEGMGEASSDEEKYKWRKAVCDEEWEATPPNLRRMKYGKAQGGGFYTQKQIRTEPADMRNTVLKMALKRAKVGMTINVTACSDMFSQDLEDMDEAMREHVARHGEESQEQPAQQEPPTWPDDVFDKQLPKFLKAIAGGKSVADIVAWAETKGKLTDAQKAKLQPPAAEAKPTEQAQDAGPVITFATVADAISAALKAKDGDALAAAADLIGSVADEAQRKELREKYHAARAELAE